MLISLQLIPLFYVTDERYRFFHQEWALISHDQTSDRLIWVEVRVSLFEDYLTTA